MRRRLPQPRSPYRITLTCGCAVKARIQPIGSHVTYGCTSGLRHGYWLRWTAWTDTETGRTGTNATCPAA